jgi:hypothetical protein
MKMVVQFVNRDSDREMVVYLYTWHSRYLEELRFSFSFFSTATTTEELGVAHYRISSQPNVACGHNKRQRLAARNIYIKLDEVQPR